MECIHIFYDKEQVKYETFVNFNEQILRKM